MLNEKDESIGEETKRRVKRIIKENNYTPNRLARSLVTKRSQTIGLIIPDVRNPFFTDLVRSVEDVAEEHGYNVFFCNTDESLKKEISSINAMEEKQVEGLVIVPASKMDIKLEKRLETNVPVVVIDRDANYKNIIGKVLSDNYKGAYQAVNHLIDLGHKRIAFISGPIEIKPSLERKEGFLDACKNSGIDISEDDIYIGSFTVKFGKKIIKKLSKKYSAFFCGNDLIAAGAIQGLKELNLAVPKDVSIVGFDDIPLANMLTPTLTTVRQDSYNIGLQAADILIKHLKNPTKRQKNISLTTHLIKRESARKVD